MLSIFSSYPTSLVFLAAVASAALVMVFMAPWIRLLRRGQIGQQVRDDGPETHLVKQGTPTMGGVVMILAVVVVVLLIAPWRPELVLLVGVLLFTAVLGFVDDASKVFNGRSLGLTPKAKLVGQFAIAVVFGFAAVNLVGVRPTVAFPFLPTVDLGVLTTTLPNGWRIPWLYLVFVAILFAGMSNAVNLTDGLDGLAAGTVMVVMVVMAMIAYRSNMLDAAVFSAAVAGACIGFLWYNAYPADIFMGDTGSLALGAALGCLAVVTKTELLSLIIGGLFVVEALSVLLQVMHYKRTHERLFLMAPLHHHFEKKGWSETKVVFRFWIISGALAVVGFFLHFTDQLIKMAGM